MNHLRIGERCVYRGTVSVEIYAKVLDIHLDSFPFPTGLTLCDTMSAGQAFVWLNSDVTKANGVPPLVAPLVRGEVGTAAEQAMAKSIFTDPESGESLLPLARNVEQYEALCSRMIVDSVFRQKVGAAGRKYMQNFLHDVRAPARVFSSHILDVIGEAGTRMAQGAAEESAGIRL
jgi:hypothetical protein